MSPACSRSGAGTCYTGARESNAAGGGTAAEARAAVPEMDGAYPEAFMFRRMALPAYGFYVRHAAACASRT